jgi:predicted Zn-dependent protease
MDERAVRKVCGRILELSLADEAEVIYHETASALTRFANNQIEQNVAEVVSQITFRGIWGKKTASVTTSRVDEASLKRLVETAAEVAAVQKDSPGLLPLPAPQTYAETDHFCEATAACTPEDRARGIGEHIRPIKERELTGAGIFTTGYQAVAVANSCGVWAYDRFTEAAFSTQVMGGEGSGFAAATGARVADIDIPALTERAIDKCVASAAPEPLAPGEYTVILEPAAVSNLLLFAAGSAFGALAHIEQRSPLNGRLGDKVLGDNISIEDNAYHAIGLGLPFDFEGMPRQRVTLVTDGVLQRLVHDRRTAAKMDTETTGHSLPQPNMSGPWPFNLTLIPGEQSHDEIIASTKQGILVTQFHYTNVVNPMELSVTGMTRNGTFMVKDGKIAHAVRNMRFTESVIKALSNVTAVGNDLTLATSLFGGGFVVPTLRVENFTFSSATEF